jgi:hypothetical protein
MRGNLLSYESHHHALHDQQQSTQNLKTLELKPCAINPKALMLVLLLLHLTITRCMSSFDGSTLPSSSSCRPCSRIKNKQTELFHTRIKAATECPALMAVPALLTKLQSLQQHYTTYITAQYNC